MAPRGLRAHSPLTFGESARPYRPESVSGRRPTVRRRPLKSAQKESRGGSKNVARDGCECDRDDQAWVPCSPLLRKSREDSMCRTTRAIAESATTLRDLTPFTIVSE